MNQWINHLESMVAFSVASYSIGAGGWGAAVIVIELQLSVK